MSLTMGTIVGGLLRTGARQLAAKIEHEYDGLTPDQRDELRWLTMSMAEWADLVDPLQAMEFEGDNIVQLRAHGARQ